MQAASFSGILMSADKLVISGLSKTFRSDRGTTVALDGVDLTVSENEFVALVGTSGCGKSTLLSIAAGLESHDAGRITIDGDHFYIDLVFYNFLLKCFFLLDLKLKKLTHGDIGQMDFYVRYYEKEIRGAGDNPTMGLILCSAKNETMIKYTLLEDSQQVFAAKYKLYLPSEEELQRELNKERARIETEKRLLAEGEK